MNSHKSSSGTTILSFPNEILHKIISYTLISGEFRIKFKDENGNNHNVPQILVLRSVSRRFRAIGNEADIWYGESFDFGHLVSFNRWEGRKKEALEGDFFKTLLSDKSFVCCLERKSAWQFSSLEGLFAVLRDVSSFQQNARTIALHDFKNGVSIALDRLRACDRITKISVTLLIEPSDLNSIAESCPFLEELFLYELDEYYGMMRQDAALTIGSLRMNWRLRTLALGFAADRADNILFRTSLVPFNSAQTLTKLILQDCSQVFDSLTESVLSVFRNLKDLRLNPFPNGFRDILNRATFTLTTFKVDFLDRNFAEVREILSSDRFRGLKHLSICDIYSDDDATKKNLIPFLVKQFQVLETLELGMEMALPLQCQLFTNMRRLCFLRVVIPYKLTHDGEAHVVEGPRESDELRRRIVHDSFLEAFARIVIKPQICLETDPDSVPVEY
jgi:hypothetical protein